ncbi:MAG: SH3 domain-containing protein, partial [Gemmatimonadetes bacterium]|nr:SH3 domain-containing protein [Gemmatimonadota bacterium]
MNRLLIAVLVGLTLSPSLAQPVHVIDRDQVNIRSDATTQAPQVAALQRGTEVLELDRHAGWLRIRMPDGSQGWVHGQLVMPRFLVVGQGVRLREGPSTGRTSVTMLFRGQEVDRVGSEQGGWSQVRIADGRTGWLATRFLARKSAEDLAIPSQEPIATPETGMTEVEPLATARIEPEAIEPLPPEPEVPVRVQRNPYAEGLQHEAGGDHEQARDSFEEVLTTEPDNVNALFHVAKAHRHLGEHEDALEKLYRALDISGGRRDIYLTLGEVYRLQARPDSAAKYQALFRGDAWPPEQAPPPRTEGAIGEESAEHAANSDPRSEETDEGGNPLDGPWVLVGLAGVGLLALAGVTWWVVNTSQKRPAGASTPGADRPKASAGGKFGNVWEQQVDEAAQGRASSEEEESLDRQIDEKW